MSALLPITLPPQQLPQPTDRLSAAFVREFGKPAGLWLPSKLALAAADLSGNRNFGTLNGGVKTTGDSFAGLGASWETNGSSSYVISPASTGTKLSVCAVLKVLAANSFCFAVGTESGNYSGLRIVSTPKVSFSDGVTDATSPSSIGLNEWHLWTGTADGSTLSVYTDGAFSKSVAQSRSFSVTDMTIGVGRGGAGNFLTCRAAIVLIFNYVLTAAEVSTVYSCIRNGEPFPLFEPSVRQRFISVSAATSGLLLLRRRAAA